MDFVTAVKTVVVKKYAEFSGRAARSEYWWFFLFNIILAIVAGVIGAAIGTAMLGNIISLALLIPGIAVGVRRLHDVDKSGWWLLIALVPIVGALVLIYFFVIKGTTGPNRFGEDPVT